jgi:transposase
MLVCPKCSHNVCTKSDKAKGRKRYKYKTCGCHYTVARRDCGAGKEIKHQAFGALSRSRSIGRFLKVSHVAVYNWIRGFGEKPEDIKSSTSIKVVELDEMHTYISQKKLLLDLGCC